MSRSQGLRRQRGPPVVGPPGGEKGRGKGGREGGRGQGGGNVHITACKQCNVPKLRLFHWFPPLPCPLLPPPHHSSSGMGADPVQAREGKGAVSQHQEVAQDDEYRVGLREVLHHFSGTVGAPAVESIGCTSSFFFLSIVVVYHLQNGVTRPPQEHHLTIT